MHLDLEWTNVFKLADHFVLRFLVVLRCPLHLVKHCAWIFQLVTHSPLALHPLSFHASQVGIVPQSFSFHIGHSGKAKSWIIRKPIIPVEDPLLEELLGSQFLPPHVVLAKFSIWKQGRKASDVPVFLVEEVDWLLPLCRGEAFRNCLVAIVVQEDFRRTIDKATEL